MKTYAIVVEAPDAVSLTPMKGGGMAEPAKMLVHVDPASREEAPILANLLELYAHDFSEIMDLELGADGRFGYTQLPLYWTDADRHPFLIRVDHQLAGLALVSRGSRVSGDKNIWDMAEFFVVRGYRRRGVGITAARAVWEELRGKWEVRVMDGNEKAKAFWARAIRELRGEAVKPAPFEKNGEAWSVFSFESGRGAL
jgi:predicted acetyltransferase